RGADHAADADLLARDNAADLHRLHVLPVGLAGVDPVVPVPDAGQPAHVRGRGAALRDGARSGGPGAADAVARLGAPRSLRVAGGRAGGRAAAVPPPRAPLTL